MSDKSLYLQINPYGGHLTMVASMSSDIYQTNMMPKSRVMVMINYN